MRICWNKLRKWNVLSLISTTLWWPHQVQVGCHPWVLLFLWQLGFARCHSQFLLPSWSPSVVGTLSMRVVWGWEYPSAVVWRLPAKFLFPSSQVDTGNDRAGRRRPTPLTRERTKPRPGPPLLFTISMQYFSHSGYYRFFPLNQSKFWGPQPRTVRLSQ